MARYIDADALIEELRKKQQMHSPSMSKIANEAIDLGLSLAMRTVRDAPTADVVEVKHSRWEYISGFDVCNICGTSPAYWEPKPNNPEGYPPYCHNCGAKMDGGVNDG